MRPWRYRAWAQGRWQARQHDAPMPTASSSSSSERDPKRLRTIAGLPIFAVEMCGRDYELEHPIVEGVQDGEHDAIEMHVGLDDEELIEKPAGPVQVPLPTKAIYGTRSGEPLDPVKVAAGRQREMDSIYRHDVKEDVPNSQVVGGVHVKGDFGLRTTRATWCAPGSS